MYNLSYMTMHLKWGFLHRKKTSDPLKKYFRKFWCLNMQFLWKRSKCLSQSEAREVIFDFKTFKKVTKLLQNHWRNISGKSGDFKWSCFGEKKSHKMSQPCWISNRPKSQMILIQILLFKLHVRGKLCFPSIIMDYLVCWLTKRFIWFFF
jgi:hypothetical protein